MLSLLAALGLAVATFRSASQRRANPWPWAIGSAVVFYAAYILAEWSLRAMLGHAVKSHHPNTELMIEAWALAIAAAAASAGSILLLRKRAEATRAPENPE